MPGPGPGRVGTIPGRRFVPGEVQPPDPGAPQPPKRPPGHFSPTTAFPERFRPHDLRWTLPAGSVTGAGTTGGTSGVGDAAGELDGELPYSEIVVAFDDTHVLNEVKITRAGGTTQIAEDATSQSKYLKRTFERSDVHTETDDDSLYAAQWILSTHKDPALRVEKLVVQPQRLPNELWPVILSLDLLDVITVKRRPQGVGTAISERVVIQGIDHDATPETWTVTFQLSPAAPHTYFFLDRSLLDGGDYLAPY